MKTNIMLIYLGLGYAIGVLMGWLIGWQLGYITSILDNLKTILKRWK